MRFRMFESAFLILLLLSNSDRGFVSGQSEKDFLLQFRNSLTYDSSVSTKLVHWKDSVDLCRWEGVKCDSNGRVSGLDLSSESISAGINDSSSLFKLSHLQSLSLAQNSLDSAKLPSQFGHLTELRYLNLSSSGFSGQIPSSFSNLTRLVVLDLSNKFYSSLMLENPDLGRLVRNLLRLRELYLDMVKISANGNDWSSALPSSLPNLRVLSLSDAHLTGPLGSSLLKLQSLSVIRLDRNMFSSPFPPFFADFPNLKVLTISSCDLSGVVPRKLFQIESLQTIDLSNNRDLEGSFPEFRVNGSLEKLMLSYTKFSGNVPESIGNLRMLSNLDVRSCSFSGPIPSTIKNLNLLVYLDLSQNQFSGYVPSFGFLKNLNVLNLRSNRLTGEIGDDSLWKGLENLEFLDLSENSLQGEMPASLLALPQLKSLHLSYNTFSGSIPQTFFQLQNLSSLSLSSNKFSGSLRLSDFSKLTNLVSLDISHNKLSVHVEERVQLSKLFPRLETLMLASCSLQKIPNLQNQSSLMMLDLSHNELEGEIPSWLWRVGDDGFLFRFLNLSHNGFSHLQQPYKMRGLDFLDLHSNLLSGEIPTPPPSAAYVDFSSNSFSSFNPDIGNILKRVMTFSAADNKLVGRIPPSLWNATGLRVLNLSRNALSGHIHLRLGIWKIPLQKFPESSYVGNEGLCGLPLNISCDGRGREMYASGGALLD
ncbi:receptor-like protein Cf-9 [Salvia divinorum]|uniref:Receptor-like protein Cf-9 n=1 Tax=Salvia divinorum TaxID=28513 RepID=A0ABD1GMV2_SALDI